MLYASGSGEACEGLQPCYVKTVVYSSSSQTFSVHGAFRVSALIFTEPLGQKKYLTFEFIKQLSPNNNYRLTVIIDSVTTFCNLDFCFPRKSEISRGALGHRGSEFGNGGLL